MPKRFTDTEKWRDEWWASLPNDYRMIWLYLVDSCSIAGLWKKDFRGLNFNCNSSISQESFLETFGSRVVDCGNFFFIPKFLLFQYPKGLNSDKPAIVSVRKEVLLNNLLPIIQQSLGNDYLIVKDKDKDTDIRKGQRQGNGQEQIPPVVAISKLEIFEEIFSSEIFLEQLSMTHKGKDIKQAWEECYTHHSNAPNPPREVWEWKQKLNTWLTIKSKEGNGKAINGINKKQQSDAALEQSVEQYYRDKVAGK